MKSGVPWSVKGVEPEAREAAKAKARRAGLTLGAWLNQVIRDSGGVELGESEMQRWVGEDEPEPAHGAGLHEIASRIAALERQQSQANREIEQALETLAIRIAKTPGRTAGPDPALNERFAKIESDGQKRIERLSREIGMLANRYSDIEAQIERNRQEVAEGLDRVARRPAGPSADSAALVKVQTALANMEGRLEAVAKDARSAATTFEHALRAVMERVVSGEKRQLEQAHGFEHALKGLSVRIEEVVAREGSNEAEAVRALEQAVGEITEHFETIEKRRERASRAVEDALKNLTERLAESDRRHGEHVQAPLAALDRAVQRMTERIEQTDTRTEAAVAELGERLQESDARTQGALAAIGKRLHDSEERVKGTFAAVHKRFQDSDERAQSAFAAIGAKIQKQDQAGQDTLAVIDTRLSDIAERIDQTDTETKASRLALMRALDDTRKRVIKLEDRPYYVAEPPPAEEPVPEPEPAPSFARFVAEEEPGVDEDEAPAGGLEDTAEPAEQETAHDLDDQAEAEQEPPAYHGPAEEPPPFKTSEPVWQLLAAARAAARAEAALHPPEEAEGDASRLDLSPHAYEDEFKRHAGQRAKSKAKRGWARPVLISGFILAAVGFSAWQFAGSPGRDAEGRPSFLRALIESVQDAMKPKSAGEAPKPKAVHVTQGAPAPALPKATSVPQRPVASVAPAPEKRQAANPLATAKLEKPATQPALPQTSLSDEAREAVNAVRMAKTPEEREAAAALLEKAAKAGDAEAQFTLGRIYETGRGVAMNLSAARDWYLQAAGQGHVAAAFNLGMIEAQSGTREGYGHAAHWFDQAARRGLADAQFNLGMLYAQGLGIGRDPVEAFAWFSAAAAQGDAGAAAERDRIGQALGDTERARGEALARERSQPARTGRG